MKRKNSRHQARIFPGFIVALLFGCLLLGACAGPQVKPEAALQWPPAPAPAKVVYLKQIRDFKDAGIRPGFWQRLLDAVAGETGQRIGRPYGVLLDSHGRLIIVDPPFRLVHVMDVPNGRYSTLGQLDEKGARGETTLFRSPICVTEDDVDNLYITDSAAGTVFRYSYRDNTLVPFLKTLGRPTGIGFNRQKRLLYVADTLADQVGVFDLNGNPRFTLGGSGAANGMLNHPTDLFIDGTGNLYLTDPLNYRIQVFSADGRFLRTFGTPGDSGGEFLKPKGIAVDSSGNMYVADALSDSVKVYNPKGGFEFSFGARGDGPGMFWMPSGIYIDREDRIYVADTYNQRVQVFQRVKPAAAAGKGEVNR